jgi:hypothetical protein
VVDPNVTAGLAPHVPLKVHQNTVCRILVPSYSVKVFQVCPPVVDIDNDPLLALAQAITITRSPANMLDGGVMVDGLAVFVELSAGTVPTPKNVVAIY